MKTKSNSPVIKSMDPNWPKWGVVIPGKTTQWFDTEDEAIKNLDSAIAQTVERPIPNRDGAPQSSPEVRDGKLASTSACVTSEVSGLGASPARAAFSNPTTPTRDAGI